MKQAMSSPSVRILLAIGLGACAAPGDAVPGDDGPLPDDAMFEETVVEFVAGRAQVVAKNPLTVGQARHDNAARIQRATHAAAAAPIDRDAACAWNAYWLYDRVDRTGNRICFVGPGTAWLEDYWRNDGGYYRTWEFGVGTSWPGDIGGNLAASSGRGTDANYQVPDEGPVQRFDFAPWAASANVYGLVPYTTITLVP